MEDNIDAELHDLYEQVVNDARAGLEELYPEPAAPYLFPYVFPFSVGPLSFTGKIDEDYLRAVCKCGEPLAVMIGAEWHLPLLVKEMGAFHAGCPECALDYVPADEPGTRDQVRKVVAGMPRENGLLVFHLGWPLWWRVVIEKRLKR
jgi:hypothetical protein